jgi:hypothetical protein
MIVTKASVATNVQNCDKLKELPITTIRLVGAIFSVTVEAWQEAATVAGGLI